MSLTTPSKITGNGHVDHGVEGYGRALPEVRVVLSRCADMSDRLVQCLIALRRLVSPAPSLTSARPWDAPARLWDVHADRVGCACRPRGMRLPVGLCWCWGRARLSEGIEQVRDVPGDPVVGAKSGQAIGVRPPGHG